MKKTQWTALFADIRKTFISFLSIALFVALGIGIFLGIKWNEPALAETSKEYYNAHSYHDLQLSFPYGITEDDLAQVKALDGVLDAEGAYYAHGQAYVGDERYVLIIRSMTERIDTADILEGACPTAKNEIGVEQMFADATGLKVGDKLIIDTRKNDSSYLYESEFTITAIVEHPSYVRVENTYSRGICDIGDGTVDFYVLASKAAYNPEVYDNCYSELLVRGTGFDKLTPFSNEYDRCVADLTKKVEKLGTELAAHRTDSIYNSAANKIADAKKQISDAEIELSNGKEEIEDAERKIAENASLLEEAQEKYEKGLAEYEEKSAELQDAYLTIQSSLSNAGFSSDLDTAVVEINSKLRNLRSLKSQATTAVRMLDAALDYLEQYREDPSSIDTEELSAMLAALAEFVLENPNIVSQIRTKIADVKQLVTKYIEENSTLTESEWEMVETFLDTIGNGITASELLDKLNTVEGIFEICVADPGNLSQENIAMLIEFAIQMGYTPDLTGAENFLSEKKTELNGQISAINRGQRSLRNALDGIEQYQAGESQLNAAKIELENAFLEIQKGAAEINDAKKEVNEAKEKLAEGELKLSEKKIELKDAEKQIEDFIRYDSWTVQERADNPGYASAKKCAVSSTKLCFSMAILFVFVGLMVCYTSVSRNVHESQVATGVQKALGFRKKEITAHYVVYSVLAVGLGIVIGCLLGYFVIETIVNQAYERLFVFSNIKNVFRIPDALAISAVEMVLILFATWLSCHKLLKKPAIELLRGNSGSLGRTHCYEKLGLWKRLSLFTKSTINNLANDTPRVIATLVGVIGCTALVVAGMSLQLLLANTPEKHFEQIWTFDARLVSDTSIECAQENLCSVLEDEGVGYTSIRQEAVFIQDTNGRLLKADLIVPETENGLQGFINLKDYQTKKGLELPKDGVIISRSYEKHHDIHVGDAIYLLDMNGVSHESTVVAVSEHYLSGSQVVMSRSCYENMMAKEMMSNTILLKYGEKDSRQIQEKLSQTDGYFSITDEHAKWVELFGAALKSTTLVVYICLFLSAVMALLVLLNLNVVAINEKKRELIIMRINGFSIGATKKYVYRDNIVLTALGILLGIGTGIGIGVWILNVLQGESDNFLTEPNLIACLSGAGLSIVFAVITNMIALKKIDKFKASDLDRQ